MIPGPTSLKNQALPGAAQSLGLGDQLQTQLQDELDERAKQKKLQESGGINPNSPGLPNAIQSLLGTTGGA